MEKNNTLVKAINKNVRTSPRKLALVCNFIKGKKADVALRDLEFTRKKIAHDVDLKLVWDPPWTKEKMSEAAKLELNL